MGESLTDRVRAMLAENPKIRGGEVARLLGIPNANAHALVTYARRVPNPGGHGGRGGFGGQGGPVPPSGDPRWPTLAAPVLAFLRASNAGRSHADLKAWRRGVRGMGADPPLERAGLVGGAGPRPVGGGAEPAPGFEPRGGQRTARPPRAVVRRRPGPGRSA